MGECFYLLDWALVLKEKGSLLDLIDPRLGSKFNKEDMMITINVALLCCNVSAALRPAMSSVVSMLEGRAPVQELVLDPSASRACTSSTSVHDLYPINPNSNYWENRD
ncbi:hypothetical protein M0R45_014552 [Rubus argutus]|uniref:Uncharacterized protein n=1 Tax=Rubus argutus TaxID=59490 RepID=A0AAW1XP61_RUBAR